MLQPQDTETRGCGDDICTAPWWRSPTFDTALREDLNQIAERGKEAGQRVGRRAAAAILARRVNDGSDAINPRMGVEFHPSDDPGKWRMDPISEIPIALGATWGDVKPLVLRSGRQFRVEPPPAMNTRAYTAAFDEVKRLGGDGTVTSTERTDEQTSIGIFWAYDGTPSLCAPPRLYNQVLLTIADQMQTDFLDLTRLLAIANVAMADTGIAIWESKFFYQVWRPVTGIREADRGTGPTRQGDGNRATIGDPAFSADGQARPEQPRRFSSLSEAEEENGQSRIYLGIHWSFDKTEGIAQGRRVARYVARNAFQPRSR